MGRYRKEGTNDIRYALVDSDDILLVNIRSGTVSVSGSVSTSGLTTEIKVTTLDITDTAGALPATALTDRNALSVHNKHATETLYIGPATVTADSSTGTTSGWEVGPGAFVSFDITDSIILYGRAESGQTIQVKITEIA